MEWAGNVTNTANTATGRVAAVSDTNALPESAIRAQDWFEYLTTLPATLTFGISVQIPTAFLVLALVALVIWCRRRGKDGSN